MFDPSRIQEMMSSAKEWQQKLQEMTDQIAVEASSGGGMVTVKMNGKKQVLSVRIDPTVVDPNDVEMLQDLITAAINEAGRKADDSLKHSLSGMVGGMNLPGIL
jgi:DNA-binding YbaB/EbfC family protein